MEVQSQHPVWKLWLNPILRRYCRSRLRPRAIGMVLLIDVLLAGFIVAMAVSGGQRMDLNSADTARLAVIPLLVLQYIILFMLGTVQASGGMTTERDEGVIDYQRLIPMTPLAKTLGYLFGLPIREWLMFAGTLPFSIWAIWTAEIPTPVWITLYLTLISSALLYHLTGLVTGTVVRNRRVAFLFSAGCVFTIYVLLPWIKQAGVTAFVFFDYLTIRPVFMECLPSISPRDIGTAVEVAQLLSPKVKFFNLGFSEIVFTLFTQAGLMLTFLIMLYRKWRSDEYHLLGKVWSVGLFVWIQILLLGNALPLIESGALFTSRAISQRIKLLNFEITSGEAAAMSGVYGFVTLVLIFLLCTVMTPSRDRQKKALRQAFKHGLRGIPKTADAASSWPYVMLMAIAGGLSWFFFSRGLFESHWFDQSVGPEVAVYFILVLLAASLLFQTLLEGFDRKVLTMVVVFIGVVPLMIGAVLATIGGVCEPLSSWALTLSPLSLPSYGAGVLLDWEETHALLAFRFWLCVGLLVVTYLSLRLRKHHRTLAQRAAESTAELNPSSDVDAPSEASAPQ